MLLIYSTSAKVALNRVSKSFIKDAQNMVDINNKIIEGINKFIIESKLELQFNQDNIKKIISGIEKYNDDTKVKLNDLSHSENMRNMFDVFLFLFYILCIFICFVSYRKRWTNTILLFHVLTLCSLPIIFLIEGYDANFFFIYADLCEGVYGAMYQKETPIYNKGIGYLSNGFDQVKKLLKTYIIVLLGNKIIFILFKL